jgi:hypothetical protein
MLIIYLSMALQPFVGPWPLYQFLNFLTVTKTPWTGDQSAARPLPVYRTTQTQSKRRHPCLKLDLKPRTQCLSICLSFNYIILQVNAQLK